MWGSAGGLVVAVVVLAVLAEAHDVRKWPCNHQHDQNSPEVLQLLRKTANAFKQVGDIILTKTGDIPSPSPAPSPYGVYPHPFVYYPMPYPGAGGAPGVPAVPQVYPYLPVHYAPALQAPQASQARPALPAPCHAAPAVAAPAAAPAAPAQPGYPAELSDQLSSLAAEYQQAAQNECSCGCGNVEVNMRQGPSSLAPGKTSDIVVEVTLGDLTQTDAGAEGETEQKKTVNILNVSDASEGGESGADAYAYAKASSSASIEERTIEDDETNTIQVVEAINLRPETSPLQVETYDNTVAAVEDTIKKTVVVKSETEETKTIHSDNGETVINVKTYEESFPKYPAADQEISQGGYEDEVIDQKPQYSQGNYGAQQVQSSSQSGYSGQSSQNSYSQSSQNTYSSQSSQNSYSGQSSQSPQSYQQKVEVVEVQRPKYEELKKEAGVVSEIVETVDIEEDIDVSEASAYTDNKDVSIKVVDVGSTDNKQQVDSGDYEYEYEYEDAAEDVLDKDVKDLQQYYTTGAPKYASPTQGERVLAEHPHPVENVQVVVKGTSSEAYAEGLQTSASSAAGGYSSYSSSNAAPARQQQQAVVVHHDHHHHHRHGPAPKPYVPCPPAPAPKPHVPYEVPCEAHYGLPRRQQQKPAATQYTATYSKKTETYSAPQQASAPAVQTYAHQQPNYAAAQQRHSASSSEECTPVVYKPAPVPSPCPPCPPCPSPSAAPAVSYTSQYQPSQSYGQQQTTYPEQSGYSSVQSVSYTRPQQHVKTSVSQYQTGQSYAQQQTHNHQNNIQRSYSSAQPVSYTKQSSVTQYQASQQSNSAQAQGSDQSQNYIQSQSYAQPQQQVYVQRQGSYPQQSSYSQAQQSSPQTYTNSVALYSQSKGYSQPSQSYAAAPVAQQQPAPWPQAPQRQSYTSTSKHTTTTVTKQQKAQPASYTSVSVEEQPSYSGYAFSSSQQQQAAPQEAAAVVVESPKQSQPLYVAGKAAPTSQATSIAQRAVLDAYNQAVSKQATNKITPAQYPPYYFNAHANSIYAPPMIRSQQVASAQRTVSVAKTPVTAYKPAAPVQVVETFPLPDEDSAEVVPERYSNSIGAPVDVPVVYSPSSAKTVASLVKKVSAPAQGYSVADDDEDADEVASYSSQVAYSKPAAEDSAKAAVSRVASRQLYARPAAPAAAAYSVADSKGPTRIDLLPVASAYSSKAAEQSATSEDDGDALVAGGTLYAAPDTSSAAQAETVFY